MSEKVLTKENFTEEVIESNIPVLVDFWANWCGPCRMTAPAVTKLADSYEGKIKVGKVDVDSQEELAVSYGVSSIPTLIVFKNGQPVATHTGAVAYNFLEAFVRDFI